MMAKLSSFLTNLFIKIKSLKQGVRGASGKWKTADIESPDPGNRLHLLRELCIKEALFELSKEEIEKGRAIEAEPLAPLIPEVDLLTLLKEITGLRAEIRAETTAFRENRQYLTRAVETLETELERAKEREAKREVDLAQAKETLTRESILALVDVADRLEASIKIAAQNARRRGPFKLFKPDESQQALAEGLTLTLKRIGRHLSDMGVYRITSLNRPFAPEVMEAVNTIRDPDLQDGLVVEEVSAGYRTEDGIVRAAQVIVNRNS